MSAAALPAQRPLRIALLAHSTNPRGGVVHALEVGDALHALGQDVTVLAPDASGGGLFRQPRCRFIGIPARPRPAGLVALVQQTIEDYVAWFEQPGAPRFDIYHAQDSISANALAILQERGAIPGFVRTVHHLDHFDDARLQAWQIAGFRKAARVLCVSSLWQETLRHEHGIDSALVSNGVDTARYTRRAEERDVLLRERLRLGAGPVFLAVGGIEPRKNTIGILRAFMLVRAAVPQAQLIIAGGVSLLDHGVYGKEFASLAREAGLAQGVGQPLQVLGRIDDADMPSLFRLATALVFPSLREGFGLVVLEAMASGTPVVVSRVAPFTDYLPEAACAWADPGDPESIANAMRDACDAQEAARLRAAGTAVCSQYSWRGSALRQLDLYRSHLNLIGAPHA
ncbi:MAG: MSMEG_0565 family glycosyltransferase [Telluria sp.]